MRRIIIHAGPGKTGSSAIQAWLNSNREYLQDNHFYYPEHDQDKNGVSSGNFLSIMSHSGKGKYELDKNKINKLLGSIDDKTSVILSSEIFFNKISDIYKILPEAEFIVYLRNPIEVWESNYNQSVKRHHNISAITHETRHGFQILPYLSALLADMAEKLIIKPYGNEIFYKNNLIDDFLSCCNLYPEIISEETVNPSYTFEAMEFKRHLNHFDLGLLSRVVDGILQGCPLGEKNYSILCVDTYKTQKKLMLTQLDEFIQTHQLLYLLPFKTYLEKSSKAHYRAQETSFDDLHLIAEYIKNKYPTIFLVLKKQVNKNLSYPLPNLDFYSCFDTQALTPNKVAKDIKQLMLHLDDAEPAEKCRELSLFFKNRGNADLAYEFIESAYILRPKGEIIRSRYWQAKKQHDKTPFCNFVEKLKKFKLIKVFPFNLLRHFLK